MKRSFSALGVGSALNGLLAYVFFVLVTRALGAEAAAPVSILWVWWSFAAAALTFPLQHWVARSVTVHAGEGPVRRALPGVASLVLLVAAAGTLLSWVFRDLLFGTDGVAFPLLIAGTTVASGAIGIIRGVLTARRQFASVGISLTAENGLRCVIAAVLAGTGVDDPRWYGVALLLGYLSAAVLFPAALRLRADGHGEPESPLAFLGGAAAGQVVAQAVLTGGPVVLAAAGGAPVEVTALFAALAVFRAPYTLALGLVAPLTARLTELVVGDRRAELRRFRLGVLGVTAATLAVGVPLAALVGPWLLDVVFTVRPGSLETALVCAGTVPAVANLVLATTVLARGGTWQLARVWLTALVPGAVVFALVPGALMATVWSFWTVETVAFVLLLLADARGRRPGAGPGVTQV